MKIVQLIYSLTMGGAERFVVNLSNELANVGNKVTIVQLLENRDPALSFNKQFISEKVRYINIGFDKGFSIFKAFRLCNAIRELKPDVVQCHLNVIPYIFPLALYNKSISFYHTLHTVANELKVGRNQKMFNRYFYGKSLIFPIAISDKCLTSFQLMYPGVPVKLIENGAPTIAPTCQYEKVVNEISKYKKSSNTKVFVHAARCNPAKNQDLLIESFNRFVADGADAILLIMGSGFDSDKGVELQNKSCDKIFFLGAKSNVGDYLLLSDFFCLSSNFEGLPISLLEAFSAGVTPVCTAVGGIKDVILDGETGYLCSDLTVNEYLKTLWRAYNKPIDRNVMIHEFSEKYSMEICARKHCELFRS